MKQNCPLFIYDHDGTLADFPVRIWALEKKRNPNFNISLGEFKAQHPGMTMLVPGMADLIKYTASIGNNVLVSGGDPVHNGPAELKDLLPLFQNWTHNGEPVPLGCEPPGFFKDSPSVSKNLLETFKPSMVVVIGNDACEARLANNIRATALFLRESGGSLLDEAKDVPHKHIIQNGQDILSLLQDVLGKQPQQQNLQAVKNQLAQHD